MHGTVLIRNINLRPPQVFFFFIAANQPREVVPSKFSSSPKYCENLNSCVININYLTVVFLYINVVVRFSACSIYVSIASQPVDWRFTYLRFFLIDSLSIII